MNINNKYIIRIVFKYEINCDIENDIMNVCLNDIV